MLRLVTGQSIQEPHSTSPWMVLHMSYSLNSFKAVTNGSIIGIIQGDTGVAKGLNLRFGKHVKMGQLAHHRRRSVRFRASACRTFSCLPSLVVLPRIHDPLLQRVQIQRV